MANWLYDNLTTQVRSHPQAPFARLTDGRHYTYADVDRVSARFANVLAGLGLEPGDRVAVQVEKSIEALMLYLGTVRAGGVFLPLNTAYTPSEVDYFVTDATPKVVVCTPKSEAALKPIADKVGASLETLGVYAPPKPGETDGEGHGSLAVKALAAAENFETVERGADDLAAILYTSGTTGRSKGAMLTHDNLLDNAQTLAGYWHVTSNDVLLHALPIYHTHGLFVASNTVLVSGASMIFLNRFDVKELIALMPEATMLMGVPTFYTRLLGDPGFTREVASGMRLFISGSAPLLAETHRQFSDRTGQAILERYGMTETNMNTSNPYDGDRRAGTVGFPLPGVELRIVDPETGKALPQGDVGMIEVRGPNVFKGYWNMPEKTAQEFRDDGFFITGDLGVIDDRGYVSIVGRGKDLIISGGFNVYPKEIEGHIDDVPGVVESAVIGLPHPDFGEGVAAVVVPEKGSHLDEAAIIAAIKDKLAKFKQPKRVFFVDALPRNTMGKVQKNVLRDTYKDTFKS